MAAEAPPLEHDIEAEVEEELAAAEELVSEVLEEPAGAPGHLEAFAQRTIAFLKSLLGLPGEVLGSIGSAVSGAAAALGEAGAAIAKASGAAFAAAGGALDHVAAAGAQALDEVASALGELLRAPAEAPSRAGKGAPAPVRDALAGACERAGALGELAKLLPAKAC